MRHWQVLSNRRLESFAFLPQLGDPLNDVATRQVQRRNVISSPERRQAAARIVNGVCRMARHRAERAPRHGLGQYAQRLRLWSGLTLFTYVTLHFVNHALGHFSLAAMETMLVWNERIVQSLPGTVVLYGAMATHVTLALWRVATIGTWRRPLWEWTQVLFGLAIPWFLLTHLVATRGATSALGLEIGYATELVWIWPDAALQQSFLMLAVWFHGCLGIHFWLRLRPWYSSAFPHLLAFAILLPAVSLTGWIAAARRLAEQRLAAGETGFPVAPEALRQLQVLDSILHWIALAAAAIVVAAICVRWALGRFRKRARIAYADGVTVSAVPGMTLLEVSRAAGIPHMAVCGGRARCSTCRTLVVEGGDNLSPPAEAELQLLRKLNAGSDIRLACQALVRGNVSVRPLIQPQAMITAPGIADPLGWGVEREIAVMFLDIRGFSRISERSLPYDVVFILNSLFGNVGGAIEANHGYIDKFMGDGLMALFGLDSSPRQASRDALRAALAAEQATHAASRMLTQHLNEPLRIGIGVDTGQAVIGRIGKTSDQREPSRLTAIGGTVNIAARLESATKELQAGIVVSTRTLTTAGIAFDEAIGERSGISVHNISQQIDVVAVRDAKALATRLEDGEAAVPAGRRPWRRPRKASPRA